jgi:ubiquinol-cytochrome c reductase cytochrome c1 subunit
VNRRRFTCFLVMFLTFMTLHAEALNIERKAQLRQGALIFKNYCSGCHSLQYVRVDSIESALNVRLFEGIPGLQGPFVTRLPEKDAIKWFGRVPPDLSLKAKEQGVDWLYTFLTGFYKDAHRPFGVNNKLLADVAMPEVLTPFENSNYEETVQALVAFLAYTAEPAQLERERLGFWVLSYLVVLLILMVCLQRSVWKNVGHSSSND